MGGRRGRTTRKRSGGRRKNKNVIVRNKSKRKKHRGGSGQDIWGIGTSSIMNQKGGEPLSYTRLPVDIRRDPYLV
jgi:hypothetical protein